MLNIINHKGNVNQNHDNYNFTPVRIATIRKNKTNRQTINKQNIKCQQRCREMGTLVHCWWERKMVQLLWKTVWRLLKTFKIELLYDLAIPLLDIYSKNWNQDLQEIFAPLRSLPHYSQWLRGGSNLLSSFSTPFLILPTTKLFSISMILQLKNIIK